LPESLAEAKAMLGRKPHFYETLPANELAEDLSASAFSCDEALSRIGQGWWPTKL
jgi:hypothetical protein